MVRRSGIYHFKKWFNRACGRQKSDHFDYGLEYVVERVNIGEFHTSSCLIFLVFADLGGDSVSFLLLPLSTGHLLTQSFHSFPLTLSSAGSLTEPFPTYVVL